MLTRTASSPACVSAGTSTPRACLSPWPMGWAVRRAAGKQVRRRERDQVRNSPANNFLFRFVGALEERKSWASIFPCAPNESIQHEFRRCCMQSSSPGLRFLLRFLLRSVAQPPRDPAPCRRIPWLSSSLLQSVVSVPIMQYSGSSHSPSFEYSHESSAWTASASSDRSLESVSWSSKEASSSSSSCRSRDGRR